MIHLLYDLVWPCSSLHFWNTRPREEWFGMWPFLSNYLGYLVVKCRNLGVLVLKPQLSQIWAKLHQILFLLQTSEWVLVQIFSFVFFRDDSVKWETCSNTQQFIILFPYWSQQCDFIRDWTMVYGRCLLLLKDPNNRLRFPPTASSCRQEIWTEAKTKLAVCWFGGSCKPHQGPNVESRQYFLEEVCCSQSSSLSGET